MNIDFNDTRFHIAEIGGFVVIAFVVTIFGWIFFGKGPQPPVITELRPSIIDVVPKITSEIAQPVIQYPNINININSYNTKPIEKHFIPVPRKRPLNILPKRN